MLAEVDALLQAHCRPDAPIEPPSALVAALHRPPPGKVLVMPRCEGRDALTALRAAGMKSACVMMDPWYRARTASGRTAYLTEMIPLLHLAGVVTDHIYTWGYAEHVARLVDHGPANFSVERWITWHFKNLPHRARGWRPAQQACLHLRRKGARMYPEHFYPRDYHDGLKKNRTKYKLTAYDVIEAPMLVGFVGRSEQTGFAGQKPRKVIQPMIQMSCRPGDLVVDFSAGSGTTGEVAAELGCSVILADRSPGALRIAKRRLEEKGLLWEPMPAG